MSPGPQEDSFDARTPDPRWCPRANGALLDLDTGRAVPAPCRSWRCPVCSKVLQHYWINRLNDARPERFFTLTLLPQTQRQIWLATKGLWKAIRRKGIQWDYFATLSRNPRGTGTHLHGLQKGDYLHQPLLSGLAQSYGLGWDAHIAAVQTVGGVGGYVTRHLARSDVPRSRPAVENTRRIRYSKAFFPSPPPTPTDTTPTAKMRWYPAAATDLSLWWTALSECRSPDPDDRLMERLLVWDQLRQAGPTSPPLELLLRLACHLGLNTHQLTHAERAILRGRFGATIHLP